VPLADSAEGVHDLFERRDLVGVAVATAQPEPQPGQHPPRRTHTMSSRASGKPVLTAKRLWPPDEFALSRVLVPSNG
jgi:hypothetical protein